MYINDGSYQNGTFVNMDRQGTLFIGMDFFNSVLHKLAPLPAETNFHVLKEDLEILNTVKHTTHSAHWKNAT